MLKLTEHHNYKEIFTEQELRKEINFEEEISIPQPIYFKSNGALCFRAICNEDKYILETSYYIGLHTIKEWNKTLMVSPKVNDESQDSQKLNVLGMLTEALSELENFNHLEGLSEIYFDEKWIEVESDELVPLTPFLVIQFLMVVKQIVKMGLKKSYYTKKENLRNRTKGKILVSEQIKKNILKHKLTNTVCSYQEFGVNTEGNQFIKYVLRFLKSYVTNYKDDAFKNELINILNYNLAVFTSVDDKKFSEFKVKENNSFYKIYNTAYNLGNQILKLIDYSYNNTSSQRCKYPPHWIDMSKLFELYVFKKLREQFPEKGAVTYHYKANYQELDFIIKSNDIKAVVDAKYKPRYKNGNPSKEDIRQLSGYTRLEKVYKELAINEHQLIPAFIIYPNTLHSNNEIEYTEEILEDARDNVTFWNKKPRKVKAYKDIFLIEIKLPCHSV